MFVLSLSQFWQRQSNTLSFLWNTYSLSTADEIRREYHGYPSIDPVTRQPNVYYPGWKRRLWYVFSVAAMLPLLSLGVLAMTLSLNLNGYVKNRESPIYVEYLARYAEPVRTISCRLPLCVCRFTVCVCCRVVCLLRTHLTSCGWCQH